MGQPLAQVVKSQQDRLPFHIYNGFFAVFGFWGLQWKVLEMFLKEKLIQFYEMDLMFFKEIRFGNEKDVYKF